MKRRKEAGGGFGDARTRRVKRSGGTETRERAPRPSLSVLTPFSFPPPSLPPCLRLPSPLSIFFFHFSPTPPPSLLHFTFSRFFSLLFLSSLSLRPSAFPLFFLLLLPPSSPPPETCREIRIAEFALERYFTPLEFSASHFMLLLQRLLHVLLRIK